mgnify:CR=1 FL=1
MASETLKVVLDPNGIDQVAAIIAHLKKRNDELTTALTAVQELCDRQLDELRKFRRPITTTALPHCVCAVCEQHRERQRHRGGDAGAEQE